MGNFIFLRMGQLKGFMKGQNHQPFTTRHSHRVNFLLALSILLLLTQKEVSIQFNVNEKALSAQNTETLPLAKGSSTVFPFSGTAPTSETLSTAIQSVKSMMTDVSQSLQAQDRSVANDYSNMTYDKNVKSDSRLSFAQPKAKPKKNDYLLKKMKQEAYVKRFRKVAQAEMRKYGIPASITLAQGLIESNAGESRLTKLNNNHFGMKCFSKKCNKGHCSNFNDDSHKDFFRKYETAWHSFRAHSLLLLNKRYRRLFRLKLTDYKGWATGLQKAGYATDPKYAQKLIHIIEELQLYQYDR